MPRSHDLEFHVSDEGSTDSTIFHDFDKACAFAASRSMSTGGTMTIDVVTWTRKAARDWGGEAAAESYDEDPEASVHDRLLIKAESLGHVA